MENTTQKSSTIQEDPGLEPADCSKGDPVWISGTDEEKAYIYRCCQVIAAPEVIEEKWNRSKENTEIINEHKRRHVCKRCGYWSSDPKDFRFFEMHIPKERHISVIAFYALSERLIEELERRDMYCRKCYRLIRREVTHNIPAPPVKPFRGI